MLALTGQINFVKMELSRGVGNNLPDCDILTNKFLRVYENLPVAYYSNRKYFYGFFKKALTIEEFRDIIFTVMKSASSSAG